MLNWPIIPMVYNDSFTYMEWLGKLNYVAENHEERIDAAEKEIIDLWAKVNDHEDRIGALETWRTDVVDPFIETTTETLADHERRIKAAEDDIDALQNWKLETVDPFIVDITTWKNDTVDPFITTTNQEIAQIKVNATAEASTRENADAALNQRVNQVETIAKDASTKVNRINIDLENIGAIRYFLTTPTITTQGTTTILTFNLPDKDWNTIDVRFSLRDRDIVEEFRITGLITEQVPHETLCNGIDFTFNYDSTNDSISISSSNELFNASNLFRFDYILYKSALTPDEQDQRDVEFFNAMDANGDGKVDASDASMVLNFYSAASTGQIPDGYDGRAAWEYYADNINTRADRTAYPDFNEDGKVNAVDASFILGYYSFASTTDSTGLTGPELMKIYRTQLQAKNEEEE